MNLVVWSVALKSEAGRRKYLYRLKKRFQRYAQLWITYVNKFIKAAAGAGFMAYTLRLHIPYAFLNLEVEKTFLIVPVACCATWGNLVSLQARNPDKKTIWGFEKVYNPRYAQPTFSKPHILYFNKTIIIHTVIFF